MPAPGQVVRLNLDTVDGLWSLYDAAGNPVIVNTGASAIRLGRTGGTVGFYGTTPIALQTGVAVSAGGVHAALVALGLITA
jgi:hypothetical protein